MPTLAADGPAAVWRFLGMANYLSKFVPAFFYLFHPLREAIKKNDEWNWTEDCKVAVNTIKKAIASAGVLKHLHQTKEIVAQWDAS